MRFAVSLLIFVSFAVVAVKYIEQLNFGDLMNRVEEVYGKRAVTRTHDWLAFLKDHDDSSEWQKINKVNHFFNNHIEYKTDEALWGKKDYWANPIETLGRGMGDCEDYAIAKYFSLISLGVPEDKIRLMYVRQLTVNEPHMVLIYFESPGDVPFVLDNFNHKVLAATQRRDLKPIYSFNGQGLWLAKAKGLGKKVKNSRGVSAWNKMLERIEQGELNTLETNLSEASYAKLN